MKMKLIYGIRGLSDDVRKIIEDELIAKGAEIVSVVCRFNKAAVLHSVDGVRGSSEQVVLIASHRLDNDDPFTLADLISCQEAVPQIRVILVMENDAKGTSFLKDLYNNGFYHAVYGNDSDEKVISSLAINGRTPGETRTYYGITGETNTRGLMSTEKALEYVLKAKEDNETYASRLRWIKDKVGNDIAFREIINRLPDDVKESLSSEPDFETYIAEYMRAKKEEEAERERQKAKAKELEERERELKRQEAKALAERTDAKSAVVRALRRMVIGVSGTEHRVGCTHHAIHLAHYLSNQGYSVALAEYAGMDNKILGEILYSVAGGKESYRGVDYYPNFSLSSLPVLNTKNYHFVIIDFGVYREEIREEFGRCVQQIVVCGSKPWEIKKIKNIFSILKGVAQEDGADVPAATGAEEFRKMEEQLSYYNFLMAPVEEKDRGIVAHAIEPFKNVYFADYVTNPFLGERCDALAEIMSDYMVDVAKGETAKKSASLKEKIGRFFS